MSARTPEDTHALIEAAFNAADADAFVAVYEADAATTVPPSNRRVQGRDAIRAAVAPILARRPRARIEVVEPATMSGSGTIVSRRQPDGSWRVVLDIPERPL